MERMKLSYFWRSPPAFWCRLIIAFFAAILFRYPFFLFQLDAGSLQSVGLWNQDFKLMCDWDCGIYSVLSENYEPSSSAFFPLFPFLIRFFHLLIPSLSAKAAALAVSSIFTILCGILLLFFDEIFIGKVKAQKFFGFSRNSWLLLLSVSIFPSGHFWMRGYSESVFVTLLVCILYCIRYKKWIWAAPLLGLISVLRPQGIWVLGLALGYLITSHFSLMSEKKSSPSPWGLVVGVSLISIIPLSLFMGWLWLKTGNPLYFYTLQSSGWGRSFDFISGLKAHLPKFESSSLFLYLSLFAAYRFMKREENHWKFLGAVTFALADLPLFIGGHYSYVRFMSANLGLFVLISELMAENTGWRTAIIIWSTAKLAVQTYHAGFGLWAG